MAGGGSVGAVGPFPAGIDTPEQQEEYDKLRRRVLWTLPYGLYVLGSRAGDRRNGMTMNWVTPGVVRAEAARRRHREGRAHPRAGDRERRCSCSTPCPARTASIVRKFTKPVEVDEAARTLNGFPFHDGVTGAPILDQAPAFVECEVRQPVEVGNHTFFIGEVVACGFQADEDTPVLRMEDTRMNYGG